ncbi:fibronectin type III domain-containing protein [Chengkuizengella axinellae]|uniref:glucan endo-1,3-beta-D-glucosidase n=1 Tax=Chengkuizengella axinellae TaxID=3064388 RepID=A0ABT9J2L9_9BACL|nr:glycosyl hydrolase [Chengkuizengella sp. 2205SS18-9]MDP5275743.1 glycosyl hydrolase [Chengkuizengella sp. 2205SS18-9]
MKKTFYLVLSLLMVLASLISTNSAVFGEISEDDVAVGAGGYSTVTKGGQLYNWVYENERRTPQSIDYTTSNFDNKPLSTNDWISSVVWLQYSGALYAHPLGFKAVDSGFQISNPPKTINVLEDGENEVEREIRPGQVDLEVQATTFSPVAAEADKITDWSADILMPNADGSRNMKVTIGHGSPYAYFTFDGAEPKVVFKNAATILREDGSNIQLSINNNGQINVYGVYAPTGTTWTNNGSELVADLPSGKDFISIAGLPDNSVETYNLFMDHAFAFVTDTKVEWNYDEATSTVTTDYIITTTPMEGSNTDTITALYPHQWRDNPLINESQYLHSYNTIRGKMKTLSGQLFSTQYVYNGILPFMPELTDPGDLSRLEGYVQEYYDYGKTLDPNFVQPGIDGGNTGYDTYWMGKNLGRISNVLPITTQLEDTAKQADLVQSIKNTLEWWFTPTKYDESGAVVDDNYFYYDDHWKTLIGYPSSYGAAREMNDHHFHYGYWIYAAAQVALLEPNSADAWYQDDQWGGMVNQLVQDIATIDRTSTDYLFLRNFDLYAGHSWANGVGYSPNSGGHSWEHSGNNQESSSEAMNAWAALILWGEATGDTAIRDAGIYMYTTERQAINNYWFDLYGDVFDPDYTNDGDTAVMVWGGKYNHITWWTEDPIEAHGIQMLPVTGASLYLGMDPNYVKNNYDRTYAEFPNYLEKKEQYGWEGLDNINTWQDIMLSYYALYDPAEALLRWKDTNEELDPSIGIEFGESRARTYQWMRSLDVYGLPNFDITANTPLYAVLNKDGLNTYVAYNASEVDLSVTFSDCYELTVPAKSMAQQTAASPGGDCAGNPIDEEAPSTPSNLTSTGSTSATVDLDWDASTDNRGVAGYDIYQVGNGNTSVLIGTTTSTNYTVMNLSADTAYTFEVTAKDAAGNESAASNRVTVTTDAPDTQSPTAPDTLNATNIMETTVELSWGASTDNVGVTGYDVYQVNDGNTSVFIGTSTSTDYTVANLVGNTAYTFEVRAKDAAGNESTASNRITVTTDALDIESPTAPGNLSTSNITETSVDLNWDASTDNVGVTAYDIYQVNNGNSSVYIDTTTSTSYTVVNLSENTNYTFEVRAKDAVGNESMASNQVTITTLEGDTVISEPNYTIEIVDEGSSVLMKFTPKGATSNFVDIHYKVNNGGQINVGTVNNNGTWEYDILGVSEGDVIDFFYTYTRGTPAYDSPTYSYTVGSSSGGGNPGDTTPPSAPSNLSASGITETTVELNWDVSTDNVGVTGYDIYQGSSIIGSTSSTTFSVTGLTADTTYMFEVKAKDAAGNESSASNSVNVTTHAPDITSPSSPSNITSSDITETSVDLSWDASTDNVGVTGYDIYQDSTYLGTTTATVFSATGLTANTTYTFEIRAKDAAGNESAGSSITVTTLESSSGGGTTINEDDYTIVIEDDGSTVIMKFTPIGATSSFVDLHYKVNNGGQINVRTNEVNGTWEYEINNLSQGDDIDFFYTYTLGTPAYDSPSYSYTVN